MIKNQWNSKNINLKTFQECTAKLDLYFFIVKLKKMNETERDYWMKKKRLKMSYEALQLAF